ncbi:MAG: cell division protein FtsA [Alphaproteobacteria bacterium]|nr:cell division protein FtsA [Alphaproteobacteria bacterium]
MTRNRHIQYKQPFAALDIGTSKVCCFIARATDDAQLKILGVGQQMSRGLRSGNIIDMEATEAAILNAVHDAEKMANETIRDIIVSISTGQPTSLTTEIEIPLLGEEVTSQDIKRTLAFEDYHFKQNDDRWLIHAIPISYNLDGHKGIKDPKGMFGKKLAVDVHTISANSTAVKNLTQCVSRCHLNIKSLIISSYAAGLASLVDDEMDLGVTVIDMGGGTTKLSVFFDGNIIYTDQIPIGGNHVTNDIARGLSTPLVYAERLKTLYGSCISSLIDEQEIIDIPLIGEEDSEQINQISRSILVGIIQPRLEETFELVRSRLELSGFNKIAGRRVVLTGGASQLTGARELASIVLDKKVRVGRPLRLVGLADSMSGPAFSTCAGLLIHAMEENKNLSWYKNYNFKQKDTNLLNRLSHWLWSFL